MKDNDTDSIETYSFQVGTINCSFEFREDLKVLLF